MSDFENIKAYMRDINLDILMDKNNDINIDVSKRYNSKFRLFYPSRKLIKCVTESGGVLTGSRALRCYTISSKPILDRRVTDWDFVVTLEQAFKICDEMGINQVPSIGTFISIDNQRAWRHPDYSDSYRVGVVDVQLMIKEELPDFKEIKGIRIANFGYTISNKIGIINNLNNKINGVFSIPTDISKYKKEYSKHIDDLKQIIIKFNNIKLNDRLR